MTVTAAILIFISVFMHVAWNMLSKSTRPSTAFYLIMNFVGGIIWLPFFIQIAPSFWGLPCLFYWLLAGSCVFEVVYMYGLAHGYKNGDISLIYPLVRALPVVMLAVITLAAGIGKPFDLLTFGGMVMIAAGCFIMPFASFRNISLRSLNKLALLFIALGAIGTTGYTLCDSQALKFLVSGSAPISTSATLGYLFLIQMGLSLGEVPLILFDSAERTAFKQFCGKSIIYPVIAGVCSSGAYALILFAMQYVTNVSFIQAFRQLSLPLGFLAGVIFLHEKSSPTKVTGLALILTGLLITTGIVHLFFEYLCRICAQISTM
jgi:drug/metabolite transporter (DMT)-like permease